MRKLDYPIWKTGVSGFDSFRDDSRKEAKQRNLKHGEGKEKHQEANPCVHDQI
jgi:hypothetical protein